MYHLIRLKNCNRLGLVAKRTIPQELLSEEMRVLPGETLFTFQDRLIRRRDKIKIVFLIFDIETYKKQEFQLKRESIPVMMDLLFKKMDTDRKKRRTKKDRKHLFCVPSTREADKLRIQNQNLEELTEACVSIIKNCDPLIQARCKHLLESFNASKNQPQEENEDEYSRLIKQRLLQIFST